MIMQIKTVHWKIELGRFMHKGKDQHMSCLALHGEPLLCTVAKAKNYEQFFGSFSKLHNVASPSSIMIGFHFENILEIRYLRSKICFNWFYFLQRHLSSDIFELVFKDFKNVHPSEDTGAELNSFELRTLIDNIPLHKNWTFSLSRL